MTLLKYKEFQGSAVFEDGRILIQILHIDDFITAECDSASDVENCFENLIDEYLETCAAIGKDPCKPYKGSFNVRVTPEVHKAIALAATESGISLNAWIERALSDKLDRSANVASALQATLERLDHQMTKIKASSSVLQDFVWTRSSYFDQRSQELMKEALSELPPRFTSLN